MKTREEIIEAYTMWGISIKKYSPNTIREYLRVIKGVYEHIDILNAEKSTDIDAAIVKTVNKKIWDANYTFKMSCIVGAFCDWAIADKLIKEDPYPYSGFRKPKAKRPKFVTPEDCDLHLSNPFLTLQDVALITVLWATAVRVEECSRIEEQDFVFNERGGYLKIPAHKSKGGYGEREIPIAPDDCEIIKKQLRNVRSQVPGNCVFVGRTWQPMTANSITDRIRSIGEIIFPSKPFIVRLTPHMFRHGRGVVWLLNDVPHPVIMRWLGHNSLEMLTHYINLAAEYSQKMAIKFMPQAYAVKQNQGDLRLLSDVVNTSKFPSFKIEAPSQIFV